MDELEPLSRLSKDIAAGARLLTRDEARFLVDAYYMMQENRIRTAAQERSLQEGAEPNGVLTWLKEQDAMLEKQIARALDKYSAASPVGEWARSVCGIGPVIAAGLLAHIDIERAPTAGHIWAYAGLDPTKKWEKGQKRPWNASLKTLCWKIGESFVKVKANENDVYGKIYDARKAVETEKNARKEFAAQAAAVLERKKIGKDTDAYKAYSQGMLPPAHIHARAKRYAVKLFLAHFHEVAYRDFFKTDPPLPYAIAIQGHAHVNKP